MKINKNSLQAKLNNLAKEKGVHVNVLLVSFFFDAFIERLSQSRYSKNFIFKGGFYLATLLGVENRYTADIDFLLRDEKMEPENLKEIIDEVLKIPADDSITFEISNISRIRDEDSYGGYSILLTGHLENIRQNFHVDVATGDPVTPSSIDYSYKRLLDDGVIRFKAYNLETVLAEKLQTILARGVLNSRCKDFYDIFIIGKLRSEQVDLADLKSAFEKTCVYRKTIFSKENADEILTQISQNETMHSRWKNYARKSTFAKSVSFGETVAACKEMLEKALA